MTGQRKHSAETNAKLAASLKAWAEANPEAARKKKEAMVAGRRKWLSNPENAAKMAKAASERMKRRHQDPEFQKRRNERSSRTMKKTWETKRDVMMDAAHKRYAAMAENETGICSKESIAKKNAASKWIMKKAKEALRTETDYNDVFNRTMARLREEMPYDGPQTSSDYIDYLRQLGVATTSSRECREIADRFMSEAIVRFSAEYRKRQASK